MSSIRYIGTPPLEVIRRLELRQHENEIFTVEQIKTLVDNSICAAYLIEDIVIAIIGYVELWEGVVEVWILPSKHLKKYAKSFIRGAKVALRVIMEDNNLHRVQTHSLADPATDSWMRHMGFVCEGTLVGYTQNRHDYRMWAKYGIIGRDGANGVDQLSASQCALSSSAGLAAKSV